MKRVKKLSLLEVYKAGIESLETLQTNLFRAVCVLLNLPESDGYVFDYFFNNDDNMLTPESVLERAIDAKKTKRKGVLSDK